MEELRKLALKIATMYYFTESQIKFIEVCNKKDLHAAIKEMIPQLVKSDLSLFDEGEMKILRQHGFMTEEEEAAVMALNKTSFEACVVYHIFKQSKPFGVLDVMMDAMDLYNTLHEKKMEVPDASRRVGTLLDLFSHKNVGYLLETNGEYEINPLARIGE